MMNLTMKQAATKALADLQLIPGWERLDERLQEVDPFGTNTDVVLQGITQKLEHSTERPVEVLTAESDEHGERNPYLVRALLYILNDLRIPAAIWSREKDGKQYAELVVYEG
jgi:hypothetical protein